jgi:hypothetical protein
VCGSALLFAAWPFASPVYSQDPQPSPETRSADVGSKANESLLRRYLEALFEDVPADQGQAFQPRRLPDAPYQSPPFPFNEHLGPIVGIRDEAVWPLMEAVEDGPNGQFWKDSRIKIYGWADPSVTWGTSQKSNIPEVYNIVPNTLQLSQAIVIFERQTDSYQTDHIDWGFKLTNSMASTIVTPRPRGGSVTSSSSTTNSMVMTRSSVISTSISPRSRKG